MFGLVKPSLCTETPQSGLLTNKLIIQCERHTVKILLDQEQEYCDKIGHNHVMCAAVREYNALLVSY